MDLSGHQPSIVHAARQKLDFDGITGPNDVAAVCLVDLNGFAQPRRCKLKNGESICIQILQNFVKNAD